MYLYKTKFTYVVDQVPLYNSHSRKLPMRVARQRSKLIGCNFEVIYKAGTTMLSYFGSTQPGKGKIYSKLEAEQHIVENEEEENKHKKLKGRFEELSVKDGVILRGGRVLIM